VNLIVSEADRGGGPLTQSIALKTGIPYTLANWYPTSAPEAQFVGASVGFSGQGSISVYGIEAGKKVILVDDLLSSGGTSEGLIKAILEAGATIDEALFVGEKVNKNGRQLLAKEFPNIKVTSLVRFISEIENGVTVEAD
jgi:adenine phosphoribosyltransferase